jgi:excisionase family DNA binding protein
MSTDKILAGYMTEQQLADELAVALRTLHRWRAHKKGPPSVKVGRDILYSRASVKRWLERLETKPEF